MIEIPIAFPSREAEEFHRRNLGYPWDVVMHNFQVHFKDVPGSADKLAELNEKHAGISDRETGLKEFWKLFHELENQRRGK